MRFYSHQHQFYCGIDLHARSMFLCIMDQSGQVLLHRNYQACPNALLKAITPFREDIAVAVECIFTWYWIADLCSREGTAFVLGHALYMKAIHGGKTKNDKIDSQKIAALLRSGMLPMACVYPQGMRFTDPVVRTSVEVDAALMDTIHLSCARLVKCTHESGGKRKTGPNNKIGNVHLKWAFNEAACLFLRRNEGASSTTSDWSAGTAKPRRCRSSPRNSGALYIPC